MRRLQLDYERKASHFVWVGWLLLAAGVICAGAAGTRFVQVNEEKAAMEATLARVERKRVPVVRADLSEREARRYAEEIKSANAIAERLTLPWHDVFAALEQRGNSNIALLSVQPEAQKSILRIVAEAKNKAEMLAYVRQLNKDKRLAHAVLLDHQLEVQIPGQPVRFSMQASWTSNRLEQR